MVHGKRSSGLHGRTSAAAAWRAVMLQKRQMQPFTDVDGVDIVSCELGTHTGQPLQQILPRGIDIAHFRKIDEQSCRDYVLPDQRSCLRCPVPVERAFHLERWTTRKPPNFCSEHCLSSNRLDNAEFRQRIELSYSAPPDLCVNLRKRNSCAKDAAIRAPVSIAKLLKTNPAPRSALG